MYCVSDGMDVQVTTMYENVQREKEALVGKVAAIETEAKAVRDQLASSQETCATTVKVHAYTKSNSCFNLMWCLLIRRMRDCSQ